MQYVNLHLNKGERKKYHLSLILPVHKGSIIIMVPYDYTVEVTSRFKGLDLIDRVPEELWTEVGDIVQEAVVKTISNKVVLVTQLCPNLCDPMDCSLPRSSVHRISQARILEWVAISPPGDLSKLGI